MAKNSQHLLPNTQFSFENPNPQQQSAFFQLPGEVRNHIYPLVLAAFQDTTRPFEINTYWSRPYYLAQWKTDTSLMMTCKRAYQEAKFVPWFLARHTFWLTANDRAPANHISRGKFAEALKLVHSYQGDHEVAHVHFFAQMWALERTNHSMLRRFLQLPHFLPKEITITIRHTDWYYWEDDEPLWFAAGWLRVCEFPVSTSKVHLELETLERKKAQLDSVVDQMKKQWALRKVDGSLLSAHQTNTQVSRWRGTSTWAGRRWTRDESIPHFLDYYVVTLTWQYEHGFDETVARPDRIDTQVSQPRLAMSYNA